MLLDKNLEDDIYKYIKEELKFKPSIKKDIIPFDLSKKFLIYNIENMEQSSIQSLDDCMFCIFLQIDNNLEFFAIDYQHISFLSNINKIKEDINNPFNYFYPSFYPDGDYYFFIEKNLKFGYLTHPWRKEIYIFGDLLINKMLEKNDFFEKTLKWKKV